jgi:hypothetical protein
MISKPKSFLTLTGRRPEERGADRDELSRRRQGLEHDQIGSCQSGLMIVKHFWGENLTKNKHVTLFWAVVSDLVYDSLYETI